MCVCNVINSTSASKHLAFIDTEPTCNRDSPKGREEIRYLRMLPSIQGPSESTFAWLQIDIERIGPFPSETRLLVYWDTLFSRICLGHG